MDAIEEQSVRRNPIVVEIASVTVTFKGKFEDPFDVRMAASFIVAVEAGFDRHLKPWAVEHRSGIIFLNDYQIQDKSVEPGSVKSKFKIAFSFTLGAYGAIAAYPSFKVGLPELQKDITKAVEEMIEEFSHQEPHKEPERFEVIFRREEEIENDIKSAVDQ